jgi:cobalt-zinc-cadmium efflux system protein
LTESLKLSLDAVPTTIQLEEIKKQMLKTRGIRSVHHMHIWAMSTTKNAMTAHLILEKDLTAKQVAEVKYEVKHALAHLNIQHVTLETEIEKCKEEACITH